MIDKIVIALPLELSTEEREKTVRAFVREIGADRVGWIAAIHSLGKDVQNPHAHIIIRDRDPLTGRRVLQTAASAWRAKGEGRQNSTERFRLAWERVANRALFGRRRRIDRRSLAEQGVEREPTIHRGPRVEALARKGQEPERASLARSLNAQKDLRPSLREVKVQLAQVESVATAVAAKLAGSESNDFELIADEAREGQDVLRRLDALGVKTLDFMAEHEIPRPTKPEMEQSWLSETMEKLTALRDTLTELLEHVRHAINKCMRKLGFRLFGRSYKGRARAELEEATVHLDAAAVVKEEPELE